MNSIDKIKYRIQILQAERNKISRVYPRIGPLSEMRRVMIDALEDRVSYVQGELRRSEDVAGQKC